MGAQACGAGVKKLGEPKSRDGKTAARRDVTSSQVQAATDKPPEVQPALSSSTQAATSEKIIRLADGLPSVGSAGATNGSDFSIAPTFSFPPPLHPGVPILTGTVPSPPPPAAAPQLLGTNTPPPAPARDAQMPPPEKVGKPVTLDDLLRPNVVAPPAQELQPPLYWPPQPQWGGPVQHWPQGYHPEAYGYAAYAPRNGFTEQQHATAASPSLILPPPSSGIASLQATSVSQLPMSYGGGGGDNSPRSVLLTMCGAWGALKAGPVSTNGSLVESASAASATREDLGNSAAPALPRDALLKYRKVFGAGSSQKPVEVVKAVPVSSSKGGARARRGRAAQGS